MPNLGTMKSDTNILDYYKDTLASDVTMTSGNTYYDGPSRVLGVGTWRLVAIVTIASPNNTAQRVTAKLWNGATVEASSESVSPAMGTSTKGVVSITLSGIIVVASGTETWKISVASTAANSVLKAATVDNGAGNNATVLRAFKLA